MNGRHGGTISDLYIQNNYKLLLNMKTNIYKFILSIIIIFGVQEVAYAYVTLPSTSYSLEVGVDKYLSVPDVSYGYIDHAVWTCSNSAIVFKEKDASGAIIQITTNFSGIAIIELVATEKYIDSFNHTRANTYYKQYLITCEGGSSSNEDLEILLPKTIELNLGETKHFKILFGNCYNGAFNLYYKDSSPKGCVISSVNYNTGDMDISGVMVGEANLHVSTTNGDEIDCKIVVSANTIISNRRTEENAIADIKTQIIRVLQIAFKSNPAIKNGDINGDGEVNVTDVVTYIVIYWVIRLTYRKWLPILTAMVK